MLSVLYDDAVKCQDRKFLFYGITVGSLPFIASSPFGGGGGLCSQTYGPLQVTFAEGGLKVALRHLS